MTLRPCLEVATGNIHLVHLESVDLNRYEILPVETNGNTWTIDAESKQKVEMGSSFGKESARIEAANEALIVSQALAKNKTKK